MITDLTEESLNHTFLLEEGVWKAAGEYFGEDNQKIRAQGWIRVHYQVDHWFVARNLTLEGTRNAELINHYYVQPGLISLGGALLWTGHDPVLGEMRGHYGLLKDTILCQFYSIDERYHGNESLLQIDALHYKARGMLLDGWRKSSAWSLDLCRAEENECCE
ncbi:hypothetical protein LARV_01508 [Longilinea arvoryzae]|uniref:Uncharacterized protein n=1 Tax=Longilinea arvoryzae TaxID=360412 RepID=A0A0S7BE94_9CHLR|nr:hypothetical protein [Longilinea arvoryzae]GAP13753.1 hypothetical protein LARV_01508 [Longilinea arvoryzae]